MNNDWGAGYCHTYEIINRSQSPLAWSVSLDLGGTLNQNLGEQGLWVHGQGGLQRSRAQWRAEAWRVHSVRLLRDALVQSHFFSSPTTT